MSFHSGRLRALSVLAVVIVPLGAVLAVPQVAGADSPPPSPTVTGAAPAVGVLKGLSYTATLSAELTSVVSNNGIPDQTITFTLGAGSSGESCTAITGGNSGGNAMCSVSYSISEDPTSYTASFAGSDEYQASSGTASLNGALTPPTGPGAPNPNGGDPLVALLDDLLALLGLL